MNSGMNVIICEPDVSPLQISGPKAGRLIQKLFDGSMIILVTIKLNKHP